MSEDNVPEDLVKEPDYVYAQLIKDSALEHLAAVANIGASFSVSVIVDGQIIYGDLISGKAYCEKMYKNFVSSSGDEGVNEAIGSFFKQLGENVYTKEKNSDIPTNYLHLDNYAIMRSDGGVVDVQGALLRVAIDRVSAFSLGRPGKK
jgi:hypothetical protein